jgi:predicted metal-dependent hydrolase
MKVRFSMIRVSEKEIETHLKKWQDILRLRDWDIQVRIVKTKWRKSGDAKVDLDDKKAVLLVNHAPKCEKPEELEELVVHELLHVKLYGLDQMLEELLSIVYGKKEDPKREFAYTQFMTLLESTVEDLTKGYLAAVKSQNALSFGRLRKSIDKEIGSS